ncbi:YciI family protein [Roseibium sp. M-1]
MPRFLAVYTMQPDAVVRFRALPRAEQDAIDERGLKQWMAWTEKNAASIVDGGGMVGKTLRVTADGIAGTVNPVCGYLVVEAETVEAAARLFEDHPHFTVFPGDGVEIMPFVTGPDHGPGA